MIHRLRSVLFSPSRSLPGAFLLGFVLLFSPVLISQFTTANGLHAQEQPDAAPEGEEAAGEEASAEDASVANDQTEEQQPEPEEKASGESIFGIIYKGGWTMVGLGLISTIIVAFSLERVFYFRRQNVNTKGFYEELSEVLSSGGPAAAQKKFADDDRLLGRVLAAGLKHRDRGSARVEKEIESAATVEIGKLERGLNLLANLGNLAPLLGFFGTVVGMRASFLQFVEKAAPTAQDLAGGVEEALITTAAGLLVAIPTYLAYNLFIYYIDNFTMEVERASSAITGAVNEEQGQG